MSDAYWFYTLSAIPQTLGAIIALSATFIIFKLDLLQRKRQDYLNEMIRYIMILNEGKEAHEIEKLDDSGIIEFLRPIEAIESDKQFIGLQEHSYKKLIRERNHWIKELRGEYTIKENDLKSNIRLVNFLKNKKKYFEWMAYIKEDAHRKLRCSLIITSFAIIFSLILLPLYCTFPDCYKTKMVFIFLAISLAISSIVITAYNVYNIAVADYNKK